MGNVPVFAKTLLICLALLIFGITLNAQTESYLQTLTGIIKPGAACTVTDEKFSDGALWATVRKHQSVQNLITFEIRFDTAANFYAKPFDCELLLEVRYKDSTQKEHRIDSVRLDLHYDSTKGKAYQGIAYYKFGGGHEVTIKVKAIRGKNIDVAKAGFLRIKNQILIDRIYKPRAGNVNASPYLRYGGGQLSGAGALARGVFTQDQRQIDISWEPADYEYDNYDLEYTFYDESSWLARQHFTPVSGINPSMLEDAFRNNATRVTLNAPNYLLNLVYPKGYLLIRIRAFNYEEVDGEWDRVEYPWHYMDALTGMDGVHAVYKIGPAQEHEKLLNWQYSAAFAEEGKRKEVVSYFDGGFKSRQAVTVNSTDKVSVVQETVMDKQNRPAVSILPVPTDDHTFHYYPSFNVNQNGQPYSYADFNAAIQCASVAAPMSAASGASRYYSGNNPFAGNGQYPSAKDNAWFTPDAQGFPFAVTEYTNDQTGRIRRQGGVGPTFQLDAGHATSYYYGKPSQEDLDRLFGSEAGSAAHYSKNMVVDANGQTSVSYVDMAGKTVATALAGNSPDNLLPLERQAWADRTIKDELIRPQNIVRDAANKTLSFNTSLLVPASANYSFQYQFNGRSLELLFGFNPEKKLCADCYYDVKFSISDECGEAVPLVFNGQVYQQLLVPATFNYGNNPGNPNTSCGVVPPGRQGDVYVSFNKAGEYRVNYELVMSNKALEYYMEYLKQANVIKTATDFKKEYLQKLDLTGCFSDCKTCVDKLGTLEEFKVRIKNLLQTEYNITITTDDLEWITVLYNEALAACSRSVAQNCTVVDGCADQRKMMLKDVTPGGQYMLYDPKTLLFKERNINVFLKVKADAANSPEVILNRNGIDQRVRMGDLQESEFISYFQPEWAYLILKYHPEGCLLQECEQMSAMRNREKKMMQTDDDDRLYQLFKWKSDDYTEFIDAEMLSLAGSPYHIQLIRNEITGRLNNFVTAPLTNGGSPQAVTLMNFIRYTVYGQNKPAANASGQVPYINLAGIPNPILCIKTLEEWRLFRNLYIAIKQAALRNPANRLNASTCSNCYIGVNSFSTLYNEKADPQYYPRLNDFVIEEDGLGGLQVKFNRVAGVHNKCQVLVRKAEVVNGAVRATLVADLTFEEGDTQKPISNSNTSYKELYFVEQVVNNYHHSLLGTNSPLITDFRFDCNTIGGNGWLDIKYIGKHPLLSEVELKFKVIWGSGCADRWYIRIFKPLESELRRTVERDCDCNRAEQQSIEAVRVTNSSCITDSRWPSYFQKTRRFYESNDAGDLNTVISQNNGSNSFGGTNGAQSYQTNCENQAEGWLEKLKACFTGPTDPRRAQLKLRLIAVCVKGSDQMHPFGASTTANNQPTAYGDRSFKDAIVAVMGSVTPTCNELLIDFPVPYGDKTPLNDEVTNQLKPCGYNLLIKFRNEWQAAGGASNPAHPTIKEYIVKKYDPNFYLTDVQINELITTYQSGCPLKRPIRIPGLLSRCDNPATPTCLTCVQLYNVEQRFKADYPQFTSALPNYYDLLASYINRTYQMNISPTDVYSAVEKCKSSNGGTGYQPTCNSNLDCKFLYTNLQNFYTLFPHIQYYLKARCSGIQAGSVEWGNFWEMYHHEHLARWLDLTMGKNYGNWFTWQSILDSCGMSAAYQPLNYDNHTNYGDCGNNCNPTVIDCCEGYDPLATFKTLYPGLIQPRLLAHFFTLRRFMWCGPGNLPDVSSYATNASLISYFNSVVPNVVPHCVPANPVACELWQFSFDSLYYGCDGLYDTTYTPNSFVLCTKPISPLYQSDPDDCLKSTVNAALANAEYAYTEYIKEVNRDYREAYFAKCMSITPSLVMEGQQLEHHYTLYYYDQSGNLVKTIPPAGVVPLDDVGVAETGRLRDEDNGECYKNSQAPLFNSPSHLITVPNDFYPTQGSGPVTVESWVKINNTSSRQLILNQFDDAGAGGKAGYYAYIENGRLYFRVYGRSEEVWKKMQVQWLYPSMLPNVQARFYNQVGQNFTRYRQFRTACHTENLITTNGPSSAFYHLVFQFSGDPADTRPLKVYVNGRLQTLNWEATNGNGTSFGFTDNFTNVPSAAVPTVDEIKYEQVSVTRPFTTASTAPLQIGSAARFVDGQNMSGFVLAFVKQVRVYNAAPDAADIRRSSYDECYMPASKDGLVLWLPLHKKTGTYTAEDLLSNGDVTVVADGPHVAIPQYPMHNQPTYYAYNSLNQVVQQETPDAGISRFWYDRLGRLVVSQNSEQLNPLATGGLADRYSYTRYDAQGRIVEVGEKNGVSSMDVSISKDPDALFNWMQMGEDRQVTQTVYDNPDPLITADPQIILAQIRNHNSRKRVATSLYLEQKTGNPSDYNFATHYVYDISGNLKRLYQENRMLANGTNVNQTKKIDYDFDLHSGKVNEVWYQKGAEDQYIHRYQYDADNRLITVQTGRDVATLRYDARYHYYLHGPLSRTELGHEIVQGVDYAYTLQGWLKGMNGVHLSEPGALSKNDLGLDGVPGTPHREIPADVYAYSLGYYSGDYAPIINPGNDIGKDPFSTSRFEFNGGGSTGLELFNGNIAYTSYANRMFDNGSVSSYSYAYDQLNRLKEMRSHDPLQQPAWNWGQHSAIQDYAESITYDANGNIQAYKRLGDKAQSMDDLTYHYIDPQNSNRLDGIEDKVGGGAYDTDIDDQGGPGNYGYDNIGNLLLDHQGKIEEIQWTVYGKIRSIRKNNGTLITYSYDPAGNRIAKTVQLPGTEPKTTYYFRDAQGNVMAVYADEAPGGPWTWREQHLYGSSRLGMWQPDMALTGQAPGQYDGTAVGSRQYELSNHLGNVLVTVSDKKQGVDQNSDGVIDYYTADVLSAQDFYPFGFKMPGRQWSNGNYRYGFNGKEEDDEVKDDGNSLNFDARIYDPRIGRWLSTDNKEGKYPFMSTYHFSGNNPIWFVDKSGEDYGVYVDHNTQTIIVKATYYTVRGQDAQFANHGVSKWNSESGHTVDIPFGGQYKVKFDFSVKEFNTSAERDAAFVADKTGEANKFVTAPPNPNNWGSTIAENGGGSNSISVENTQAALQRFTPSHEIGHTLGLGHFIDGLMEDGSTRTAGAADNQITDAMVAQILSDVGVGNKNETPTDKEVSPVPATLKAKSTLHTTGVSPLEKELKKRDAEKLKLPKRDNLGGGGDGVDGLLRGGGKNSYSSY